VFVFKTFYPSSVSCFAVERQYRREFSVRVAPSRDTLCRIAKQFEETGSVCVINVRRDVQVAHRFVRKKLSTKHGRQ
jgi:hypothetical protein